MIREATADDLPLLTQWMLGLRATTGWAAYHREGYNTQSVQHFLTQRLLDPQSMCILWDTGDHPTAFCGGSLTRFYFPPHMPVLHEWGWAGQKRDTVRCWNAVRTWGKDRGAELAYRVTGRPGTTTRHITELATWEIL